ncbi:MAG: hypothetical protein H6581_01835 [Bacteroidia bacterium]|nr:hypothetical protein [Bacteroidia bacterium]
MVRELIRQDFTQVRADDGERPKPPIIRWEKADPGHRPDITAVKGEAMGVFTVVEDASSIDAGDLNKIQLFSEYAGQRDGKHFLITETSQAKKLGEVCENHSLEIELIQVAVNEEQG